MTYFCETMGCLPNPGGAFQQLPSHMKKMQSVLRARGEWNEFKSRHPNATEES